jgi:DNA-binding CsgD family transcriptional regulator
VEGLLERGEELDRFRDLVAAAAEGRGSAVVLEGPAGIGKTSLVVAAGDLAAARGVSVLSARGGELERDFAYGVVRQLLEPRLVAAGSDEREALLAGAAAAAAPVLGLPGPEQKRPGGMLADDPTAAALHGLYWLTANLAVDAPLAFMVDDLHWTDGASVRFLAYLARRVAELPVLLVAASRPPVESHAPELIEALGADPAVRRLEPAPLSSSAIAELFERELGRGAAPALVDDCHGLTGGNPFLVRSVVDAVAEQGLEPGAELAGRLPEVGGPAVARFVARRLGALGPDAEALAQAVAILGTDVEPRHAEALAGLDDRRGSAAADALAAAGVLGHGRPLDFVHPLVRSAAVERVPPAERALAHLSAARMLDTEGGDAERIAPHLLAAERRADPWVVQVLRRAGARSVDRGAPEAAVRYLRRALDEPPAPEDRAKVLAELGKAEVHAAMPDEAVGHLRTALEETEDPAERAAMAHDLAVGLVAPGRYEDAVAMLEQAMEDAREAAPELGRRLEAELLCAAKLDPQTLHLARSISRRLPAELPGDTLGERMLLGTLAHERLMQGARAAEVADLAGRAIEKGLLDDLTGDSGIVMDAGFALCCAGDLERADAFWTDVVDEIRKRGSVIGFARSSCMHSLLELERGALAAAESDARSTIDAAWEPGYRIARMAYGPLVAALVEQGKLDEAQAALSDARLGEDIPDGFMLNFVLFSRGRLRLAQGRRDDGIADLQELARREEKWRAACPAVFPYRSELAVALQDPVLAEEELRLSRHWGTAGAVGRSLRALGLAQGGEPGLRHLRESVELLDGSPWRLEYAKSLVELGAAVRRAGQRTEAREPLKAGMELAHLCGAEPLVERARDELKATGARPRRIMRSGVDALTASERRVAGMAAEGMTNREIAQALFVTTRTVEVHLTHAYQKLDISSREELPAALDSG